jgi:monoamine oxidase
MLGLIAQTGSAYAFYSDLKHCFADGTGALAQAIAADIAGEIRLQTPVTAIRQDDNGVSVEAGAQRYRARLAVVATPVSAMGQIAFDPPLEPDRLQLIERGTLCRMTKVWMLASGVPEGMLGAGWGTTFYWLAAEKRAGEAQLVVAFALEDAIDPEETDALEAALNVYAPGARVLSEMSHDWVNDPWARGGWMVRPPGREAEEGGRLLAEPHGRVLMAGSDVAPEFSGWIAGAIVSGRAVARRVTGDGLSAMSY